MNQSFYSEIQNPKSFGEWLTRPGFTVELGANGSK